MYKSRYLHVVEHPEKELALLYHSITQKKLLVARTTSNILGSLPPHKPVPTNVIHTDLVDCQMIIASTKEDEELRESYIKRYGAGNSRIGLLYLFPSLACNLDCAYCSVYGGAYREDGRSVTMTPENARRYVRWFCETIHPSIKKPKMILYGGEPLLGKSAFMASIEEWNAVVKQKHPGARVSVVTNGTLFDSEIISFCKDHGVTIGFSLDGPSEAHSKSRPYNDGSSSYQDSFKAYKACQEAGLNPNISCTLHLQNLEKIDGTIKWITEEARPKSMGFNIVHCREDLGIQGDYYAKADYAIYYAFKHFREIGIYEDRAMRRVNAFVEPRFHIIDCAALGRQLSIDPDGNVGVCHVAVENQEDIIGNVADLDPKTFIDTHAHLCNWAEYAPLLDDDCQDCPALAMCGGGCKYSVSMNPPETQTRVPRDSRFCESNLRWLERLGRELIEETIKSQGSTCES